MKDVNYNKASGELIRKARIAKNMTEQDLAYSIAPDNYIEVTRLIKYWEKGNGFPNLDQIYKIAEILEINPNELYYYRENERKKHLRVKNSGPMTIKQYDKKRHRELMMEDLENFGPAIVYAILIGILFVGPTRMIYVFNWVWNTIKGFFIGLFPFGRG